MSIITLPHLAKENYLLASLPREEYDRLLPSLERVPLPQGKLLYNVGDPIKYAYFPISGMISLLSTTEDGDTVEIAMVSKEGMVGFSVALAIHTAPYQMMVQLPGEALRISADALKSELILGSKFQALLLKYVHQVIILIAQTAVCNRFHSVERRLCCWLLTARDCMRSNSLDFTQEIISHMLGTPRPVVSTAAGLLQDSGFIRYRRGKIVILDPRGLERTSCECYRVLKKELTLSVVA